MQCLKRARPRGTQQERKEHLAQVAAIGCIVCGATACIHHIRAGNGLGQRASDFETLPLCHFHHQGAEGFHTLGSKVWQSRYGYERELLEQVRHALDDDSIRDSA